MVISAGWIAVLLVLFLKVDLTRGEHSLSSPSGFLNNSRNTCVLRMFCILYLCSKCIQKKIEKDYKKIIFDPSE